MATASNKLIKLRDECKRPNPHGKHNLKANDHGRAPKGYPGWPYKRVHMMHLIITDNVQSQLHRITKIYAAQNEYSESPASSENTSDEEPKPAHNVRSHGDLSNSGPD